MNKKVRHAQGRIYKGIKFKSKLEVSVYEALISAGFNPKYEPKKFRLWEGFKPFIDFYDRNSKTKDLELKNKKLIDITYTPDFVFYHKGRMIIVEAKGRENDVFYIKKKLFIDTLQKEYGDVEKKPLFFEVYNLKHIAKAIEIIKSYD